MNKLSKKPFWLLTSLLLLTGCSSKGKMPSDSVAALIRQDALRYVQNVAANLNSPVELPDSIQKLKPISSEVFSNGLLVVFRTRSVEEYGFYYCDDNGEPPTGILPFCKKVSPGFFRYYNPG